jgi:hypothetical protein
LTCAAVDSDAPLGIDLLSSARAIIGVAPGGSVARRHAVVATTTVVAASSANASAAAAANANAQAAAAKPPPPAPAAAPAGPPPVGSITTVLPPGCTPAILNNVEYQRCGSTYYRAAMQGSNLVFVVSQP